MKKKEPKLPNMAALAEKALQEAVADTIEDHRRTGDPIAIWRDGKVVLVPADQLPIRKAGDDDQPSKKVKD